jgi:hypothetical protein
VREHSALVVAGVSSWPIRFFHVSLIFLNGDGLLSPWSSRLSHVAVAGVGTFSVFFSGLWRRVSGCADGADVNAPLPDALAAQPAIRRVRVSRRPVGHGG